MPGPVSQSYQTPIDPIVQRIADSLTKEGVLHPWATPESVVDAIEGAFEAHGTPANVLRCAFCGAEYPAGTPATKHKSLTDHIMQCEAPPLRDYIRQQSEAHHKLDQAGIPRVCPASDDSGPSDYTLMGRVDLLKTERDRLRGFVRSTLKWCDLSDDTNPIEALVHIEELARALEEKP